MMCVSFKTKVVFVQTMQGLSSAEAEVRLGRDGLNELTPPVETPWYIMLLKEMVGGFATLLWIASIMCFVA